MVTMAKGGNSGGGGMVISCSDDRVYLADTFEIMSSLTSKGLESLDPFRVQVAITQVIEKKYPAKIYPNPKGGGDKVSMATMLEHIRETLVYIPSKKPLPLLGDDYIDTSSLPAGCTKLQVAIQNIPKNEVTVDRKLQMKMSSLERGLLELHESLISLRNQPGLDTTPIRQSIEDLMRNELDLFNAIFSSMSIDCYLRVTQLELVHGCFNIYKPAPVGPGPCQRWSNAAPRGVTAFIKTAPNRYEVQNHENNISAQVKFDGSSIALVSMQSPGFSKQIKVKTKVDQYTQLPEFSEASASALYSKPAKNQALQATVSCSFGLTESINQIDTQEEKEMDELGPEAEWRDPSALSLAQLPIGTILELTQDLDVTLGEYGHARNYLVEQKTTNITDTEFHSIHLYQRFAWAQFFNQNNGYLKPVQYPKGTKLIVTQLKVQPLMNRKSAGFGASEYKLAFTTIPSKHDKNSDSITWMKVYGRRSGSADIKIPQFIELVQPYFKVTLPGNK